MLLWEIEFESLEVIVSFPAAGTGCVEKEELLFQGQMKKFNHRFVQLNTSMWKSPTE